MNLVKEIAPKGILITGFSGGNRKIELLETITKLSKHHHAPIAVTTCSLTAYSKKSSYYQLTTEKKFDEMVEEKKLFEYVTLGLGKKRRFGTPIKEYDLVASLGKLLIYACDYNGLKHFFNYYEKDVEKFKKDFCILSLLPKMDPRRDIMMDLMMPTAKTQEDKEIVLDEIFRRVGYSELTERKFFWGDEEAVSCIDAHTTLITKETNLVPLAEAVIAFAHRKTEKLLIPKNLIAR